jgi:hypothetical protein
MDAPPSVIENLFSFMDSSWPENEQVSTINNTVAVQISARHAVWTSRSTRAARNYSPLIEQYLQIVSVHFAVVVQVGERHID